MYIKIKYRKNKKISRNTCYYGENCSIIYIEKIIGRGIQWDMYQLGLFAKIWF